MASELAADIDFLQISVVWQEQVSLETLTKHNLMNVNEDAEWTWLLQTQFVLL